MCPICKNTLTAYKRSSRVTSKGHIKNMWCPFCKKEQQFVQLSKYDQGDKYPPNFLLKIYEQTMNTVRRGHPDFS